MDSLAWLKKMTGESDEELLSLLLADAKEEALLYMNRNALPPGTEKTVRDLALIAYNRRGTEGENSRSEAGENYNFDNARKHIFEKLNTYRLARCGGRVYEKVPDNENETEPGADLLP